MKSLIISLLVNLSQQSAGWVYDYKNLGADWAYAVHGPPGEENFCATDTLN